MMRPRRFIQSVGLTLLMAAAACGTVVLQPTPESLQILVSNDDGIEAPGIIALADALLPLGRVTVAAPRENRSGVSHGITSDRPIAVQKSERRGMTWFAIDALPATCVRLALERLLPEKPDIVVSGINKGENTGTVTFYSATVAAAREAAFAGLPAIAVHLAAGPAMDYPAAAGIMADIVRAIGRDGLEKGMFLNINIPALPKEKIRGLLVTRQDARAPYEFFDEIGPGGETRVFKPSWKYLEPAGKDTDIWAVRNGYISISVFGIDQSAGALRKKLRTLESLAWK